VLESSPQPTTSHTQVAVGDWVWDSGHQTYGRIVELTRTWGDELARLWLPERAATVLVATGRLIPLAAAPPLDATRLGYIAAAARVAAALSEDVLLAPIEAAVIPLPHQIRALSRAMAKSRIRYLLADEVGLGKTIEAGLILRELKLRGLVRRTLVVVPKGLVTQWVAEMRTHFGEEFRAIIPGDFAAYRRVAGGANPWRLHDQIVCPLDSVKPLEKRRGWSPEEVAEHNRDRSEDLVAAGWDLVIVDEAHRLGGSTDQVARYKLGVTLAEAAPYLLLLTATPHQGKTDAFYRLVALLDSAAFPDPSSLTRERVQPYVIRTEKRRAIDDQGRPLFTPRVTKLVPVSWGMQHRLQRILYEGVSSYVRDGYNQALKEKKTYVGFLLLLMQRLVTSSTRAIRTALERRLDVLQAPEPEAQLMLFPVSSQDEWAELDGQEQIDTLLQFHLKALKNERAEVELLLDAAKRAEAAAADAKAEALLEWLYKLQQEEGEPDLKVLIFTEFVPTQTMLAEYLKARVFSVAFLNGSLDM
jgi:SNF2 family DNA or RNA helicase